MPLTAAHSPKCPQGKMHNSHRKEEETQNEIYRKRQRALGSCGCGQQEHRCCVQKMDTHNTEAVGDRDLKENLQRHSNRWDFSKITVMSAHDWMENAYLGGNKRETLWSLWSKGCYKPS